MSVQTYRLGTQNQIIDLNGASVNFDINFAVKSKTGTPFYATVVDQDQLDNGSELEYKKADGEISANLTSDKNIYKSYNLILRSDEPQDVEVMINKKIIEPKLPPPKKIIEPQKPPPKKISWKTIILITVIVIGVGLMIYFYFKGDKKSNSSDNVKISPVKSEISSPMSTHSDKSSLSRALDDISPSP